MTVVFFFFIEGPGHNSPVFFYAVRFSDVIKKNNVPEEEGICKAMGAANGAHEFCRYRVFRKIVGPVPTAQRIKLLYFNFIFQTATENL